MLGISLAGCGAVSLFLLAEVASLACPKMICRADRSGDTLRAMMTRRQVAAWSGLTVVTGSAFLVYLLLTVPPTMPDGQPNTAALLLFFIGLMMLVGGFGSLLALALHNRWPLLAGVRDRRRTASPSVAVRQGALLALAFGVIVLLAYLNFLDMAFVFVSFVLIGLLEAFLQSRHR